MLIAAETRAVDQGHRLEQKSQDQQLKRAAVKGAGMTLWEANVLVDTVHEIYFTDVRNQPLRTGQMPYLCVAIGEGPGKPLSECQMVTVGLTLLDPQEDKDLLPFPGSSNLRKRVLTRITEEAREQGGLLTQEDCALLLHCDVRTIRRDIEELRESTGVFTATRGQVQDIGPGVSHKGVAIKHWLEGLEPGEVALRINHTLKAVERYTHTFSRVVYCRRRGFYDLQIALAVGISSASVQAYLAIYEAYKDDPHLKQRFEEIELIGASHFEAEDEKKGVPSPPLATNNRSGSRP